MTNTMTVTELHNHVERKFSGSYACKAVLTAWDVKTETATYRLTFHAMGRHVAKLDTVMYVQAFDDRNGQRGAATSPFPYKGVQGPRGYVKVITTDD